jgi:ribosomal protein L37AE/L43A
MVYVGVDDGFGEYGDMACGIYECSACGEQVTGECFETSPHEETNEGYDEDD